MQQTRFSFFNSQIEQWSGNLVARFFFTTANRSSLFQEIGNAFATSKPQLSVSVQGTLLFRHQLFPLWPGGLSLIRSLVKGPKWRSKFRIAKPPTVDWGKAKSYGKCIQYFWGTIQWEYFYKLTQQCSIQTLCQSWVDKKVLKELTLSATLLSTYCNSPFLSQELLCVLWTTALITNRTGKLLGDCHRYTTTVAHTVIRQDLIVVLGLPGIVPQ